MLRAEAVFLAPRGAPIREAAGAAGGVVLRLPPWAGVDFSVGVDSVAVLTPDGSWEAGTRRQDGSWVVAPVFARGRLAVRWIVRSGKANFVGRGRADLFRPTLLDDHALAWGHTWVLRPDGVGNDPVVVSLGAGGWSEPPRLVGAESGVVGRFRALPRLVLLAGAWDTATVRSAGQPLHFILRPGTRAFTDEAFMGAVAGVAESQAGAMAGLLPVSPTFVLEDGSANAHGGTVEGTVMVLYPDPDLGLEEGGAVTLRLVAHELFHFWNGTHARPDTTVGEGWYKWFQEGMTEYVARRTLLREGFVDAGVFIAELNDALLEYASNPVAHTATASVLAERYWDAEEYRQLPYVKGFLLGFLTDLRIREATDGRAGIDAWLRRALRPDQARGPLYDDAMLLRALEAVTGRDERAWYDAYATGAEPLPFEATCSALRMDCTDTEGVVFDLGFTAEPGITEDAVVSAVRSGSPAEAAGLEVGDRLTGGASFFPGDPTQDAIVEVYRGGTVVPLTWRPVRTARILRLEDTARTRAVVETIIR